jgi:hypothetical protein
MSSRRHCEERSDEAIQLPGTELDCFAELVIGPATSGRTRWLAMTRALSWRHELQKLAGGEIVKLAGL